MFAININAHVRRVLVEYEGEFCYVPDHKVYKYTGQTSWLYLPE